MDSEGATTGLKTISHRSKPRKIVGIDSSIQKIRAATPGGHPHWSAREGKADLSKIQVEGVIVKVIKDKFPPQGKQ